jgi:hypothetical protein
MTIYDPEAQEVQGPGTTYFADPIAAAHADDVVDARRFEQAAVNRETSQARLLGPIPTSGAGDAAGFAYLRFPTVPQGFRVRVVNLAIGGLTFQAAAPGNAVVSTQGMGPQDTAWPTQAINDYAASLPRLAFYDKWQMIVDQGAWLAIQVYDSTMSETLYVATLTFIQEPRTSESL